MMPKLSVGSARIGIWPENLGDGESTLGFWKCQRGESERFWSKNRATS